MSSIPTAVDDVTLINASYLNSIKDAVEDLEDGTVPAGSVDIDGLPGPGMDALNGENDAIAFFNASASAVQKIRPNAILKVSSAGDLITWDGTDSAILSVGADGEVLTADSSAPEGLAWAPAGGGSGSVQPSLFDARLTLTSATPITTADVTAASTIYLTPYGGNQVALYDGSAWQYHTLTERSLSLSGLTSGANYDVWLYDNSGTLTLELSTAWTNDTTRADAVATQDGVRVKSGAPERRLVGTIRTTGTTTTEDSRAKRFVRNERHSVPRKLRYEEPLAGTWTYASTTWRPMNNNANAKVEAVVASTDLVRLSNRVRGNGASISSIAVTSDGSVSPSFENAHLHHINNYIHQIAIYEETHSEGYHYWQPMEAASAAGTTTFSGPGYLTGEVLA